ncbi:hypothetical protein F66182_3797 [Fusarium sp. NRRL 66182]|nr:hypothetical protein F66182_3797 [Fusarium sp. NRRL 66182]
MTSPQTTSHELSEVREPQSLATEQPKAHNAMDPQKAPESTEPNLNLRGGGACDGRICGIIPCPIPVNCWIIPCPCFSFMIIPEKPSMVISAVSVIDEPFFPTTGESQPQKVQPGCRLPAVNAPPQKDISEHQGPMAQMMGRRQPDITLRSDGGILPQARRPVFRGGRMRQGRPRQVSERGNWRVLSLLPRLIGTISRLKTHDRLDLQVLRAHEGHAAVAHRSLEGKSRSTEICAVLIIFSILSTAAVALRTFTRLKMLRSFGLDDGLMVVAQVLAIGAAVAIGMAKQAFYASVVVYNIGICIVKIGILFQYRRVFSVRCIQRITFYGLIFMSLWTIAIAFLNILVCVPVAKFWNHSLPGQCLNQLTIWYTMAGFNLVTDVVIFCIPLPVIKGLQLPKKQKIMLLAIFSLGFFTCIISIIRIRTLKVAASTKDPNWDNVDAAIWSFLEIAIAVITACLPTLRPVFSRLIPRAFISSIGRSTGPAEYGPYYQASENQCLSNIRTTRMEGSCKRSSDDSTLDEHVNDPFSSHCRSFKSQVYPSFSVSITTGDKRDKHVEDMQSNNTEGTGKGGIQTTTTVIQKVAEERPSNEE